MGHKTQDFAETQYLSPERTLSCLSGVSHFGYDEESEERRVYLLYYTWLFLYSTQSLAGSP